MRSLAFVGLTLALLGVSAIDVAAELDSEPDAVYFTSTVAPTSQTSGTFDRHDAVHRRRGSVVTLTSEASDPRLSGTTTATFNVDVDPLSGHGIMWGTIRTENDGGAWEGTHAGIEYDSSDGDFMASTAWLVGTGDYAGYSVYSHTEGMQGGGPLDSHGVIYKGQPPQPATE